MRHKIFNSLFLLDVLYIYNTESHIHKQTKNEYIQSYPNNTNHTMGLIIIH